MAHRLVSAAKELIKSNNKLSADIADELGIKSSSIPMSLLRDSVGLISLPVLEIIARHSGSNVYDLIEEVSTDSVLAK